MVSSVRLCYYTIAVWASMVASQNMSMTIPLSRVLPYKDKELYGDFVYLERQSTLEVNFSDIQNNISFIIFQVHSHLYGVLLKKPRYNETVEGTNTGLYASVIKSHIDSFTIENPNNITLKLFVAVHGYTINDPIPGGCNMEFAASVSPFLRVVVHKKLYIDVEAAALKFINHECSTVGVNNFYFAILYLPENNYDSDVYFEAIRNMTTLKNIEEYGTVIPESSDQYWSTRRRLSAYPGTGAIYVVVAQIDHTNRYSVYVPNHSYACSPLIEFDCELLEDSLTMLLSAFLFFLGIFICYFGHRFFITQIFSLGFLSGFVINYILLSLVTDIEGPALVSASALSGLLIAAFRFVCWWLYGIPAFIVVLLTADIGFLIASILYYISPGGVYLQSNLTFWTVFLLIIFLVTVCLLPLSHMACIICCAVIGGYTAIYPLDYYLKSNLKFIMNNAVRRATVPDFNKAVILPVYQWKDVLLTIIWLVVAATGCMWQYLYSKGRPPFPPPPRGVRAVPEQPAEPVVRRRSSIARFWERWRQRRRDTRSNLRNTVNEKTPLLEEE